ncbi:glycoside hydrolase [Radiomyces spectabilis]|uniref:glycoside hydrolase n=1 Tax=Radiomyces spectabilis TaxID=64574 RepID=UPI0022203827|nr:glycoside hydrolase [Radiomyces spectabilis]KAI8388237.1 glycoside hydrolase [Radiomyces spectabilis]
MRSLSAETFLRPCALLFTVLCLAIVAVSGLDAGQTTLRVAAGQAANDSLLWGTYRPNLYFGTRPRLPESLSTGLLWFDGSRFQSIQKMRHACDQGDDINGYGYQRHDGRQYASQTINDGPSNIAITTEFIKVPGANPGGNWGVRIRGKPMRKDAPSITNILFYIGLEGSGSMDIVSKLSDKGLESPVRLEGDTPDLGDFEIQIVEGPLNEHPTSTTGQDLSRTQWFGREAPDGFLWKAKEMIMENLLLSARKRVMQGSQEDALQNPSSYFTLSNELVESEDEVANFYIFQKVFAGEFQFDVLFRSLNEAGRQFSSEKLGAELIRQEREFDARFEKTFHLEEKGFSQREVGFAQYLLSNLVGGIGYFYGSSIVDRSRGPLEDEMTNPGESKPQLDGPHHLFTATPSRPFFPRGFYWDEGFHQLLIGKWDNDLSLAIIKDWVALIDENGWVAREQILGDEARSKVPAEFQTQFPHYANPPTLYLAIKRYVDRVTRHADAMNDEPQLTSFQDPETVRSLHLHDPVLARTWLESVYPKLRLNWQWFRQTQRGDLSHFGRDAPNDEAYRWRGRTPNHTLTSGLDDYPRGEPPNVGELHVDLLAWMAYATELLKDIAMHLGDDYAADVQEYTKAHKQMLVNLDVLHWSDEHQAYCDQTIEDDAGKREPVHVCHKGYVSLFPMTLGLLPADSPKLGAILDMMRNENELWSPYGLRSLSASDPFYRTGEIYWRGPIWININFMALQSLYNNYIHVPGPYQQRAQDIYTDLRKNIISNVFKDYVKTGYVWEQYDDRTGQGLRSHPFTGWTSLVLLIMAEEY